MPKKKKVTLDVFSGTSRLVRWIEPDYRNGKNRFSSAAFERKPNETYLSTNCLEIESFNSILKYFRSHLQMGSGQVMAVRHSISEYNTAGQIGGVSISLDQTSNVFMFEHEGTRDVAYRHHPTRWSDSHCGVEFVRSFGSNDQAEK